MQLSARNEPEIYDSYIDGLRSTGWNGNLDHVRLGFFMQFSFYALISALITNRFEEMKSDVVARTRVEKRAGIPMDEIPELKTQVVELLPKYGEELKLLLKRVEDSL